MREAFLLLTGSDGTSLAGAQGGSPYPESAWATRVADAADRPVDELCEAWAADELSRIEAAEALKAWADFQSLAALRRLHEATQRAHREFCERIDAPATAEQVEQRADVGTVEEVVAATGLSQGEASSRLSLACNTHGRADVALRRLAVGETTLARVRRLHDATAQCDPAVANAVATRVLRPTQDGGTPTYRSFTDRLRQALAAADPQTLDRPARTRWPLAAPTPTCCPTGLPC